MLGGRKQEWLTARLADLGIGGIGGICKAARAYHLMGVKKDELDTALGYFGNNAPRMRYEWFDSRGLFAGSGAVESGCKAVPGSASNCQACTGQSPAPSPTPRSAASRSEDQICKAPRNQTPAA